MGRLVLSLRSSFKVLFFRLFLLVFVFFTILSSFTIVYSQPSYVVVMDMRGEINYGMQLLFEEALDEAEKLHAPLLVVMDTPGGLLSSADEIIKAIKNSNVPVIGYVYPLGASAWSAGTLILMATHIAAMAPGTHIGAAQPVLYDPTTGQFRVVNESKIINPIVAIITGLAEDRGRNKTAAELFVRKNLYLNAKDALKYHVIEYVASSPDQLLDMIDGVTVRLDIGVNYTLHTRGAMLYKYSGSIRVYIVRAVSDPIVNSLLATLGVLTLIFGILSGHYLVIPLAIGLIILSLLGSGFSPNIVSLALLIIGAIALGIELFTPGFGILGFTGIILIALSIALLPVLNPGYLISPAYQQILFWTGVSLGIGLGAFTGFVLYKVIRAKRMPPRVRFLPVGEIGRTVDAIGPDQSGYIFVSGEYWKAISDKPIPPNRRVKVIDRKGSLLVVEELVEEGSK